MAKSNSKVTWLDRRIAAPGPYLALCLNEEQFHAALWHCGIAADAAPFLSSTHADATAHVLTNKRGELTCVVCLGDCSDRSGVEIAGLPVHEAVHVWQQYAERIGEAHPGVEQEAYAIQAIAQELMAEYARQTAA